MEAHVRAGIEVHGTVLRYAEVEQYGARYRLLRLGSCDFDFDVAHELLHAAESPHLHTIEEALADVYKGAVATSLNVALHPLGCYSFFSPMAQGLPEQDQTAQLEEEAALLLGAEEAAALQVTSDPVYTETLEGGQEVTWFHGLAVPAWLHQRFEQMLKALPFVRYRFRLSMQTAASVMHRLDTPPPQNGQAVYTLALGWYDSHVEYTLTRQGDWHFGYHTTVASPSDAAYFALALCNRLEIAPSSIGHLYVYGRQMDLDSFKPLEMIFRTAPTPLNPLYAVDLDPGSLDASFDAEAYVPCIGTAL